MILLGGVNTNLAGSFSKIWPLEYADSSKTKDQFYYVNNGSLVGYLGVKLISLTEYDYELEKYLEKVEAAYESMQDRFIYDKYQWTYYMLNEPTVIPPHYMIFEEKLYYVCSKISDKEFWKDGYEFRYNSLKSVLGMEVYEKDGEIVGIVHRACAPHPYMIDIYGTKIEFLDKEGNVVTEWSESISGNCEENIERFEKGEFLIGTIPLDSVRYRMYTVQNNNEFLLFEERIEVKDFDREEDVSGKPNATGDIKKRQEDYVYDTKLSNESNGQLIYELKKDESLDINNYYGVKIANYYQSDFAVSIALYDSNGNACVRYLPKLKRGKNFLLFSEIGFSNINDLENISKVIIRLYSQDGNVEYGNTGRIEAGSLVKFDNKYSLYEYRHNNAEYKISPQ